VAAAENNASHAFNYWVAPGEILFGATFYLLAWLQPLPYNRRNTSYLMFNMDWRPFSRACLSIETPEKRRFFVVFCGKKPLKNYHIDSEIGMCVNTL
jgi:hypothetical protein